MSRPTDLAPPHPHSPVLWSPTSGPRTSPSRPPVCNPGSVLPAWGTPPGSTGRAPGQRVQGGPLLLEALNRPPPPYARVRHKRCSASASPVGTQPLRGTSPWGRKGHAAPVKQPDCPQGGPPAAAAQGSVWPFAPRRESGARTPAPSDLRPARGGSHPAPARVPPPGAARGPASDRGPGAAEETAQRGLLTEARRRGRRTPACPPGSMSGVPAAEGEDGRVSGAVPAERPEPVAVGRLQVTLLARRVRLCPAPLRPEARRVLAGVGQRPLPGPAAPAPAGAGARPGRAAHSPTPRFRYRPGPPPARALGRRPSPWPRRRRSRKGADRCGRSASARARLHPPSGPGHTPFYPSPLRAPPPAGTLPPDSPSSCSSGLSFSVCRASGRPTAPRRRPARLVGGGSSGRQDGRTFRRPWGPRVREHPPRDTCSGRSRAGTPPSPTTLVLP